MTLTNAEEGREYTVREITADDGELTQFLFSLGCYSGEKITVVSCKKSGLTVSIKDARYNIDNALAEAIAVDSYNCQLSTINCQLQRMEWFL